MPKSSAAKTTGLVSGGCLLVILLATAPSAFLAWILMLCLGALEHPVPFLPLWGITFVVACIIGSSRSSS